MPIDTVTASKSKALLTGVILFCAWLVAFASRLFAVIRFESIIHEFDPWFNYRATKYMTDHGFYSFLNWFDKTAWYPLGRIVGGTVYPGLMVTAGGMHYILHLLNLPIHIREVCVFTAPVFSGLTAIATFLLTRQLWNQSAALFAACFISIAPGYISRSVAGSYDNEGIAIFALQFTFYLWIKTLKTGKMSWATATAISYFYMVSAWGGYVFIINLIPLHAFVLMIMGRYSPKLYVGYTTFYCIGQLCAMQIPFVSFQPISTSEHMASAGVFALLQAYAFLMYLKKMIGNDQLQKIFVSLIVLAAGAVFAAVVALTLAGKVAPWSGRFYSLWDTGYAKIHIPIIASVSEHQPTTWASFFFDLHILIAVFPAGLWFCVKKLDDSRVFLVIYAVFGSYFAGVMVRLMLTLTPCVCMIAAIAFTEMLTPFFENVWDYNEEAMRELREENVRHSSRSKLAEKHAKDESKVDPFNSTGMMFSTRLIVTCATCITLIMFAVHCCWVTTNAYSSPSVVLASQGKDGSRHILDDFREGYNWLRMNTPEDTKIMSWWDYGYQIAGMANRTTLVDNNTWNNSHIALVGKAMASNEENAIKIMRDLDVDYVLIIFGAMIGYSGDDINKFLWMVRIAEGEHPADVKESSFFTESGEYKVDGNAPKTFTDSIMYKLSYYRYADVAAGQGSGYDRTRNSEIGVKNIKLKYLEEAYTSENWLVRIYRVKKRINRSLKPKLPNRKKFTTKKTTKKRIGTLRPKPSSHIQKVIPTANGVKTKPAKVVTNSQDVLVEMTAPKF